MFNKFYQTFVTPLVRIVAIPKLRENGLGRIAPDRSRGVDW